MNKKVTRLHRVCNGQKCRTRMSKIIIITMDCVKGRTRIFLWMLVITACGLFRYTLGSPIFSTPSFETDVGHSSKGFIKAGIKSPSQDLPNNINIASTEKVNTCNTSERCVQNACQCPGNTECLETLNSCECPDSLYWDANKKKCFEVKKFKPINVVVAFEGTDRRPKFNWKDGEAQASIFECEIRFKEKIISTDFCKKNEPFGRNLSSCKKYSLHLKYKAQKVNTNIGSQTFEAANESREPDDRCRVQDLKEIYESQAERNITWGGNCENCQYEIILQELFPGNDSRPITYPESDDPVNMRMPGKRGSRYTLSVQVVKIGSEEVKADTQTEEIRFTKPTIVPPSPINIKVKVKTADDGTTAHVTWGMPDDFPGPFRVHVTKKDISRKDIKSFSMDVPQADQYEENNFTMSIPLQKGLSLNEISIQNCKCILGNKSQACDDTLDECSVWASADQLITAPEAAAGPVAFSLSRPGNVYDRIFIKIYELIPEKRRMFISYYEVVVVGGEGQTQSFNVSTDLANLHNDVESYLTFTRDDPYYETIKVTPGAKYTITVQAVGKNTRGEISTRYITAKTGPPPTPILPDGSEFYIPKHHLHAGIHTLTFHLESTDFFVNSKNGLIIDRGVIVANYRDNERKRRDTESPLRYKQIPSYMTAMERDEEKFQYRVDFKQLESRSASITLGNGDTSSVECVNRMYTCNGPLKPGTFYSVKGFACTDGGCSTLPLLESSTNAVDQASYVAVVVAVCIVTIIVVILLAVFTIFMTYRWTKKSLKLQISKQCSVIHSMSMRIDPTRPICLKDLPTEVKRMHKNSGLEFQKEFSDILGQLPERPFYEGSVIEKNRYLDIKPYADSVVLLSEKNNDPATKYINASYIPGYASGREFIATQGPLESTVNDFWRLVWEKEIHVIVMLTQTKEGRIDKCAEYWPTQRDKTSCYGPIEVTCTSVSSVNNYNITIFNMKHEEAPDVVREVKHFHFLTLKDHSAAVHVNEMIQFVTDVRAHMTHNLEPPVLVHCSAGVGRTGTYIAIDYLYQLIQSRSMDETVDILGFVANMRKHRPLMVQTEKQYVLVYDCAKHLVLRRMKQDEEDRDVDSAPSDTTNDVNSLTPTEVKDTGPSQDIKENADGGNLS